MSSRESSQPAQDAETVEQFAARLRASVARTKADTRPRMNGEQARRYLEALRASRAKNS